MDQDNSYYTPYNIDLSALPDEAARKKYIERVLSLPKKLVDIIFDSNTAILIEESLSPRFNLSPSQKQELTRTIRDVVLGEFYFKNLPEVVQKKLQVDEAKAKDLTKELVASILMPGWEELKSMHEAKFKNTTESFKEPPPVMPIPPASPVNPNNVLDLSKKNNP